MQKRIAMISYHTCPLASFEGKETGGMNVYVLELSKQLAQLGLTVDIYTRSQDQQHAKIVQLSENLRVIHLIAGAEQHLSKKELGQFIPDFVQSLLQFMEIEKISYDVLHCHYYLSALIGLELKKRLSNTPKLVTTFHTLALMKNLVARTLEEQETEERVQAEFLISQSADKIIAPSEADMNYLKYLYQANDEKVAIIMPGVDTKLFKPMDKSWAKLQVKAEPNHKIILFVGRIEPLKGIDVLMYAMKILTTRNPELAVSLWIVGGDITQKISLWSQELQKLEKLRRTLQLKTVVNFVGQKPQHALPYYYNAAEVVVMPSNYESFGMAALEAMASGTPVITTNVSGISTLIDDKHKSLITSANNPLLLATKIEDLLVNTSFSTKVSKDLVSQVQDLDWYSVATKINNLYNQL